ncbi:hypothetical protein [Deinococcus sp. SL84]|uniref:hypothetical protein n=1 Tax=Deinococcus sp. SL84 TaxID=2994663 RepID=UPI0022768703|nr:hypothetical protein [Deinococcus sp. SL84]MCY1703438.1 hypothetical protein [Deinococcus sp. SL84]
MPEESNELVMRVKFVGLRDPRDWAMGDNKGTTYKIGVAYQGPSGIEQCALKVDQEVYHGLKAAGLGFGADLDLFFAPRVVIRDNQQQLVVSVVDAAVPGAEERLAS